MPRRDDLHSILLIGSGPIVVGQASEFDYSGTQAIKALRGCGYRVILVNSNPATIMTDPDLADATYLEPITAEIVAAIIAKERPDALLPTLGGQTALNVTADLHRSGVLESAGVEVIGASFDAIESAEDRGRFRRLMESAGLACPPARAVSSIDEARAAANEVGFPLMLRPSYTLGGLGTGLVTDPSGLDAAVALGLAASPVGEVLVEASVVGWKEFELEVMRDRAGNAVVVCSIENIDPMGVHTGDSVTVAPAQTLSDPEYQRMRDDAIRCLEVIGVETGGSNVQFAVDPQTGRRLVIEMNPRVSRSSALASKATGFPIAKIAALLAVGFTLDEIANDITGRTPASFEPALDYVVVKFPRFDFAKFPDADDALGTSMRSVGEVMAIGRTFPEALQKAMRSLEVGDGTAAGDQPLADLVASCARPRPDRLFRVAEALHRGASTASLAAVTAIDPWFIDQMALVEEVATSLATAGPTAEGARAAKRLGISDLRLAAIWNWDETEVRRLRRAWGVEPTFKTVDTCAAEFEAVTPYFYSTYEDEDEVPPPVRGTVVVLGSGPNRIGQGVEFDYCCVHACFALREAGYRPVMINCNPETVSTDYDTSERLYFEPLQFENVMAVLEREQPEAVIVQLGGQTPLRLARALADAGVPIAGTTADAIDVAENRHRFSALCGEVGVPQPPHGEATSVLEAEEIADQIGFPVLVRPSYVLGGRGMRVVYTLDELTDYLRGLYAAAPSEVDPTGAPVGIDRFLEGAIEVDVDALFDGSELVIGGIMEHVEEAGVHSGDSACVVPSQTLSGEARKLILRYTDALAQGLGVRGLINIQFAVRGDDVVVLEANPRASRTIPFISKATGVQLAKLATRIMMGETIESLRRAGVTLPDDAPTAFVAVKVAVIPWLKFPEQDIVLGPEMRATGEVIGIAADLGAAYNKALLGAGTRLPERGTVFFSLTDRDKVPGVEVARIFARLGYRLLATAGTAAHLAHHGVPAAHVDKVGEGPWDPVRLIAEGKIDLVVNTPLGRRARGDGRLIRAAAQASAIPCITTVRGGMAVAHSLEGARTRPVEVKSLQEWHRQVAGG
ncbi:MAG: carbamoyl phosphate synthase large subunit [Actinobacteria bacterium RBG_16_67_15]|nr:MAG: carbamoyl phosphate synthase large subunit [Actinobacteria bacterium RBG_16_67_15]